MLVFKTIKLKQSFNIAAKVFKVISFYDNFEF